MKTWKDLKIEMYEKHPVIRDMVNFFELREKWETITGPSEETTMEEIASYGSFELR